MDSELSSISVGVASTAAANSTRARRTKFKLIVMVKMMVSQSGMYYLWSRLLGLVVADGRKFEQRMKEEKSERPAIWPYKLAPAMAVCTGLNFLVVLVFVGRVIVLVRSCEDCA